MCSLELARRFADVGACNADVEQCGGYVPQPAVGDAQHLGMSIADLRLHMGARPLKLAFAHSDLVPCVIELPFAHIALEEAHATPPRSTHADATTPSMQRNAAQIRGSTKGA